MKLLTTVTVTIMSFINKCTVSIIFLSACCGFSQSYKFVSNNVYKDNIRREHVKKRYTYDNTTNSRKLIEEIEFNENGMPLYIYEMNIQYECRANYKYDDGFQIIKEKCDISGDGFIKAFRDKVPGFYGFLIPYMANAGLYTIDYIRNNGVLKRKKITKQYRSNIHKASESSTIDYEVEDFKVKAGYIIEQEEKNLYEEYLYKKDTTLIKTFLNKQIEKEELYDYKNSIYVLKHFNSNADLPHYMKVKYFDKSGKLLKKEEYKSPQRDTVFIKTISTFIYDENENLKEVVKTNIEGEVLEKKINTYNEKGLKIQQIIFRPQENYKRMLQYEYEYYTSNKLNPNKKYTTIPQLHEPHVAWE